MTAPRSDGETPDDGKAKAAAREARGSVYEAIGKLIGDDTAKRRGTAEKAAGADEAADIEKSSRR